jgi:hypothetical protein
MHFLKLKKMELKIKVKNCKQCPNFEEERMYTEDSFEEPWNWFCKAMEKKKIRGYVEWHEESKVPIPEWCPAKISPPTPPKDRVIVEGEVPADQKNVSESKQYIIDRIDELNMGKEKYDTPNGCRYTSESHIFWQYTYYDIIKELYNLKKIL